MNEWNNLTGKQKIIRTLIMLPIVVAFVWFFMNFVEQPKATYACVIVIIVWIWQFVSNIIEIIKEE